MYYFWGGSEGVVNTNFRSNLFKKELKQGHLNDLGEMESKVFLVIWESWKMN